MLKYFDEQKTSGTLFTIVKLKNVLMGHILFGITHSCGEVLIYEPGILGQIALQFNELRDLLLLFDDNVHGVDTPYFKHSRFTWIFLRKSIYPVSLNNTQNRVSFNFGEVSIEGPFKGSLVMTKPEVVELIGLF